MIKSIQFVLLTSYKFVLRWWSGSCFSCSDTRKWNRGACGRMVLLQNVNQKWWLYTFWS